MTLNFILVAMDQVINHAAKIHYMFGGLMHCPMVIRTPNGAGNQLTAQHSQSCDGWFAHTPGLKVVSPATPRDAKGLLKSAIHDGDPVLVIENLAIYKEKGEVPDDPEFLTPIGEANLARGGSDLTMVSHSFATVRALHVAERLAAEHDVQADVVDLRSLRPLDMETVAASVAKTNRVLCVEEGWPTYGVTAEIAARVQQACFDDLDAPIMRVGMAEIPMPYAKNLENATLPNEDKILNAALAALACARRRASTLPRDRGSKHAFIVLRDVAIIDGNALAERTTCALGGPRDRSSRAGRIAVRCARSTCAPASPRVLDCAGRSGCGSAGTRRRRPR